MFRPVLRSPLGRLFLGGLCLLMVAGGVIFWMNTKSSVNGGLVHSQFPKRHTVTQSISLVSQCAQGSACFAGTTPTALPSPTATPSVTAQSIPPTPTEGTNIQAVGGTRDPAYWPYATNSPWNTPIGSAAQFATPSSPNWSEANKYGFIITSGVQYSIPIYVASASDPIRNIYRTDGSPPGYVAFRLHVPANIQVGTGGDDQLAIIDENHQYVTEMINAVILPNGDIQAPFPNQIDLHGSGISSSYIGSCAYGGSCIGGMIRPGEITNGIHHALRMSLTPDVLNWTAPDGNHFVWPANSADGGGNYPGTGNISIGSLLAIPHSVDISKLATPGTPLYALAQALQDYGVYITDRGYENIYVDPAAANGVASLQYNNVLAPYLEVVTNNTPTSVGGGGTPCVPLAPALASS